MGNGGAKWLLPSWELVQSFLKGEAQKAFRCQILELKCSFLLLKSCTADPPKANISIHIGYLDWLCIRTICPNEFRLAYEAVLFQIPFSIPHFSESVLY